jgi:Helix-turn-helix domain
LTRCGFLLASCWADATQGFFDPHLIFSLDDGYNDEPCSSGDIDNRGFYRRDWSRTLYLAATLGPPQTDQQTVMTDKSDDALETQPAKVTMLEEVSRYLHVHPSTLYRLLKRGEIPAFRIGSD